MGSAIVLTIKHVEAAQVAATDQAESRQRSKRLGMSLGEKIRGTHF